LLVSECLNLFPHVSTGHHYLYWCLSIKQLLQAKDGFFIKDVFICQECDIDCTIHFFRCC